MAYTSPEAEAQRLPFLQQLQNTIPAEVMFTAVDAPVCWTVKTYVAYVERPHSRLLNLSGWRAK